MASSMDLNNFPRSRQPKARTPANFHTKPIQGRLRRDSAPAILMSNSATAACCVLGTAELVENIFEHLPIEDMFSAQRTNRFLYNIVAGSKRLLQQMYLLPAKSEDPQFHGKDVKLNPVLVKRHVRDTPPDAIRYDHILHLDDRHVHRFDYDHENYRRPQFLLETDSQETARHFGRDLPPAMLDMFVSKGMSRTMLKVQWKDQGLGKRFSGMATSSGTPYTSRPEVSVRVGVKPATPRIWLSIMRSIVNEAPSPDEWIEVSDEESWYGLHLRKSKTCVPRELQEFILDEFILDHFVYRLLPR